MSVKHVPQLEGDEDFFLVIGTLRILGLSHFDIMWCVLMEGATYCSQERQEAGKLFATENGQPTKALTPAKTFVPGEIPVDILPEVVPAKVEEPSRKGPTPEQLIAIKVIFTSNFLD